MRPAGSGTAWSDDDFDELGWHDCAIHGISFIEAEEPWAHRLVFDIDYILEWIEPAAPALAFTWRVAPCTLTFVAVTAVDGELRLPNYLIPPKIDAIVRRGSPGPKVELGDHQWAVVGHGFSLRIAAGGLRQRLRGDPVTLDRQHLSLDERGGVNLVDLTERM